METFFILSGGLFWLCILFCAIFIIFARRSAMPSNDRIYSEAEKDAQERLKAPLAEDLTLSRLLDAYNEAANAEFNDSVITYKDLEDIDNEIH